MYLRSRHWFKGQALLMTLCIFTAYTVVPPQEIRAKEEVVTELRLDNSMIVSVNTEHFIQKIYQEQDTKEIIMTGPVCRFSDYDISLLERVTMSESGNQPFECQVAVAQTVINRLDSGRYGDSIYDIVYEQNQYSTGNNGYPTDSVIDAVNEAINNPPYPSNMVYFREGYYHTFAENYSKFGVLYFSLYT